MIGDNVYRIPGRFFQSLSRDDQESVSGAVQRMLIRMERHGAVSERTAAFNHDHEAYEGYEPGEIDEIQLFWLTPDVVYPPSTIASESVLLPAEETLIEACNRLEDIVKASADLVTLSEEEAQIRDELTSVCLRLQESGPRKTQKRSTVYNAIPRAASLAESLIEQLVHAVIEKWSGAHGYDMEIGLDTNSPHSGETWREEWSADFGTLIDALDVQEISPVIIGGDANPNALAILLLVDDSKGSLIREAYGRCLTRNNKTREERRQRLPIIHIGIGTDSNAAPSSEILEVISEVHLLGWFAQLCGFSSPVKAGGKASSVGWFDFALAGDLGNLPELTEVLGSASYVRAQEE